MTVSISLAGTSKGHLLYFETGGSRKPNDTARVISSLFAATTTGECHFRFWYHMYGYDIGLLNIYTRTYVDGPLTLQWAQSGSKGDEWLRRKVVLNVSQPFQVLIEGVHGKGYEGTHSKVYPTVSSHLRRCLKS